MRFCKFKDSRDQYGNETLSFSLRCNNSENKSMTVIKNKIMLETPWNNMFSINSVK